MFKLNKLTMLMIVSLTILAFSACDAKKPGTSNKKDNLHKSETKHGKSVNVKKGNQPKTRTKKGKSVKAKENDQYKSEAKQVKSSNTKDISADTIEEQFAELGIKPIKDNKSALGFTLLDLDGKEVSLRRYKGKIVLMNFWFIACPFCKNEKKDLEKLKAKMKGKDFVILAVSVDKEHRRGEVEMYKEVNKMTVTVLHDPTRDVANSLGLGSVPTSYIIDKNGTLLGEAAQDRRWGEEGYVKLFNQLTQQKVAMK